MKFGPYWALEHDLGQGVPIGVLVLMKLVELQTKVENSVTIYCKLFSLIEIQSVLTCQILHYMVHLRR